MQSFILALGYLTRLAPARVASLEALSKSCCYYPFVGLLLGAVTCIPFYYGLLKTSALLQGWLLAFMHVYLTRALHFDGLADISDAFGSNKQADAFHAILKDSHIGAFGALATCVAFIGQVAGYTVAFTHNAFALLIITPVISRSVPLLLAFSTQVHPQASLGNIVALAPRTLCITSAIVTPLLLGLIFLPFSKVIIIFASNAFLYLIFTTLVRKAGGYNGDFLGAIIVCSEVLTPIAYFCL